MVFGYRKGNFEDCDWEKSKVCCIFFPKLIHKTWVRSDTGRIFEVRPSQISMTVGNILSGHSQHNLQGFAEEHERVFSDMLHIGSSKGIFVQAVVHIVSGWIVWFFWRQQHFLNTCCISIKYTSLWPVQCILERRNYVKIKSTFRNSIICKEIINIWIKLNEILHIMFASL